MSKVAIAVVFSCVAGLAVACTAAPAESEDGPIVASEHQGLAKDPLLGSVCRACGCDYVARVIDGCTVYRCECDSVAKANCVVNAPGSRVIEPGPISTGPVISYPVGTAPIGTAVLAQ